MFSSDVNSDPENNAGDKQSNDSGGKRDAGVTWEDTTSKAPWTTQFMDSFRRDPNPQIIDPTTQAENSDGRFDQKAAAERTANSGLKHKLKKRHLQMIAIGGSIGGFSHVVEIYMKYTDFHHQVLDCSSLLVQLSPKAVRLL
jgi:amino acid transporter